MALYTPNRDAYHAFAASLDIRATESYARGEPLPSYPPKPSPPRDAPIPDYFSLQHRTVHDFLNGLEVYASWNWRAIPPCSDIAFALVALALFDDRTHPFYDVFWCTNARVATAHRVQRGIESAQYIIIPAPWKSAGNALNTLAARDEARAAALKRKMQAGGARAGVSPQKTPRLTRAAAARQTQQQQPEPATSTTTSPTSERKRRRTPPLEAPAPQRASARQLKQRADVTEDIPPAVVASTSSARPTHTRSRSASQESNETLVASSSSSSLSSSRAASVLSADTVVVVEVVSDARGKGKGRLIAPVLAAEEDGDADVAPMDTDGVAGTGMVTRSRTKKVPEAKPATRKAPYPATMGAQFAAGRRKGSKAPTGKRKVAKSKAK